MTRRFALSLGLTTLFTACNQDISLTKNNECEALVWYLDADGDGYGGGEAIADCEPVEGYVENNLDCDDTNPAISPAAQDICNSIDDDCDTVIDNGLESDAWYFDGDGDGFGDDDSVMYSCSPVEGYIATGGDCDDAQFAINPAASEICDELDNDCDGAIDNGLDNDSWYVDSDGDGFGDPDLSVLACDEPDGYVDNDLDCDDTDGTLTLSCDTPSVTETVCPGTYYEVAGPSTGYPELHLLSAYEPTSSGIIYVQVDSTAPMTLVMSSYEPVQWVLSYVPGAQIQQILLNGYHSQTIVGASGIPVETRSYDQTGTNFGGSCGYSLPYNGGGCDTNQLIQGVTNYTGLDWTSFNGCYTVDQFIIK